MILFNYYLSKYVQLKKKKDESQKGTRIKNVLFFF